MNVIVESLGDPIWQIGGGIIMLAVLVLILALRSSEVHLSPRHQWLWTRFMLLVGLSLFLVLSAGVVLFHGAHATPTVVPAVTQPSPTPFPRLAPSPAQVLTTFCAAIDRHDLNTAWEQYAKALQKERTALPPLSTRITIAHCRMDRARDMSATGFLLLKTIGPYGYTDDYERPFQFTLSVEAGAWKITQIARCLADGCLPDTTSVVP